MTSLVYTGGGPEPERGPTEKDQRRIEKLMAISDHIEMDHERELAPGDWVNANRTHKEMHANRSDWGHNHKGDT